MSDQQTYRTRAEAFASQVSLPFGSYRWSGLSGDFSGKGAGAIMLQGMTLGISTGRHTPVQEIIF